MDMEVTPASPGAVVADPRYFMVMGIDVAVRTAALQGDMPVSVAEHIVPPAGALPLHAVRSRTLLVGLAGKLTLLLARELRPLHDSQVALIPAGVYWGYRNTGKGEARLMVISFSAEPDRFLEEVAHDPRRLRSASARHHVVFAEPGTSGPGW